MVCCFMQQTNRIVYDQSQLRDVYFKVTQQNRLRVFETWTERERPSKEEMDRYDQGRLWSHGHNAEWSFKTRPEQRRLEKIYSGAANACFYIAKALSQVSQIMTKWTWPTVFRNRRIIHVELTKSTWSSVILNWLHWSYGVGFRFSAKYSLKLYSKQPLNVLILIH